MSLYKSDIVFTDEEIEELKTKSIYAVVDDFAATTGIRGDETPQELLKRFCVPPLGGEAICEEFDKYGYTYTGICDGFKWREDALKTLTEAEAWKMIALANIYWRQCERDYRRNKT